MNISFLKTSQEAKVSTGFVAELKKNLHVTSGSISISFTTDNDVLGVKVTVKNLGSFPTKFASGVDEELLDAILEAMAGNLEKLNEYTPEGKNIILDAKDARQELFDKFWATALPKSAQRIKTKEAKELIMVTFSINYQRDVKFFFGSDYQKVVDMLNKAKLL